MSEPSPFMGCGIPGQSWVGGHSAGEVGSEPRTMHMLETSAASHLGPGLTGLPTLPVPGQAEGPISSWPSGQGPQGTHPPACVCSPGFYELSDAGSCSLSTSCASVCSDRLSPSLSSLLSASHPSKSRPGVGDWRPRSADESTVPVWRPQPAEEGGRLPDGAAGADWPRGVFRPRPVSTGERSRRG